MPCCTRREAPARADADVRSEAANRIVLLATGDVGSDTEECGCKARRMGGIARRARIVREIEREHAERTLVLDAGDLFFRSTMLSPRDEPQARESADFLARALESLHTAAMAVGERDLTLGLPALRSLARRSGTALLAANLVHVKTGTPAFDLFKLVERGGVKIGIVGAAFELSAGAPAHALYASAGLQAGPADSALESASKAARHAGAEVVVALLHLGERRAREVLAKIPPGLVDLAVVAHDRATSPLTLAGASPTAFAMPGDRGKWLLRIDLDVVKGARGIYDAGAVEDAKRSIAEIEERVGAYQREDAGIDDPALREKATSDRRATIARLLKRKEQLAEELRKVDDTGKHRASLQAIPIDVALPEDSEMLAALNAFKDRLKIVNAKVGTTSRAYVGVEACRTCHAKANEHWRTTRHARAWATMERTRQTANLDCVPCHSTGFDRPGGPTGIADLAPFVDVGCEACHGAGGAHVANPEAPDLITRRVPERVCAECHRAQADQKPFTFEERLPLVLGRGHGR